MTLKSGIETIDLYISGWKNELDGIKDYNPNTKHIEIVNKIKQLEYQINLLTYIKEELLASKKDSYKN